MTFLDNMKEEMTKATTENGANTYSSTLNANLDFFAQAGAMRSRLEDVRELFVKAFAEDKRLAVYNLVHLRNVRLGGVGERDAFRSAFRAIINNDIDLAIELIQCIPYIGRWDDVVYLWWYAKNEGRIKFEESALQWIKDNLQQDLENLSGGNNYVSLLAKWLPSQDASNKTVKKQAKLLAKALDMSNKEYRQSLSKLRKHLNIIERNLSQKEYENIELERIPSRAMFKYRTALHNHLGQRMVDYIEDVSTGDKKMNTSNMLPDEIVSKGMNYWGYRSEGITRDLEVMWDNLDNVLDMEDNALIMADVSGSMSGKPMEVAIGLALYTAERIEGAYKDHFMSFSANPSLIHVPSSLSLQERINIAMNSEWGMNTDLTKAFETILDVAVKNNSAQKEMPSKLIIISDMEFDDSQGISWRWSDDEEVNKFDETVHEDIKRKFESKGYRLPEIVYWNVDSRQNNIPVRADESGVALVSGYSPNILKTVIGKDLFNPTQIMLDTLDKEEYKFLEDIFKD